MSALRLSKPANRRAARPEDESVKVRQYRRRVIEGSCTKGRLAPIALLSPSRSKAKHFVRNDEV